MGALESHPEEYDEPASAEASMEVRISVYKLRLTGVSCVDEIAAEYCGAYHTGVVFAGEEWSFGSHRFAGRSGVARNKPKKHEDHIFVKSLVMGELPAGTPRDAVRERILRLARSPGWTGPSYDPFERNCNHFSSELTWLLLKKRPPDWINNTAEQLSRRWRKVRARSVACQKAFADAEAPQEDAAPKAIQDIVARGFREEFETTFDAAWDQAWETKKSLIANCPEGIDSEEVKRNVEAAALSAAVAAAGKCAALVAAAAREGATARAAQNPAGLQAWDYAWRKESAILLRQWRESCLAGTEPTGTVQTALSAAADAARGAGSGS
eukprot:gnl/TRDRNA2_/TRDRNA2_48411_c0_seq1.p1 gnl/TRDRNA2_/TRDRNA2_48411_c0~~gnl/TRDRNA2_/TRDRNA2_48411_c0_seq1.p1  ORF type:complete len:325 (-),score=59.06 gnl/TRDRNA2_/TRDRNA2_48411_c0_seq1:70-1044(-)